MALPTGDVLRRSRMTAAPAYASITNAASTSCAAGFTGVALITTDAAQGAYVRQGDASVTASSGTGFFVGYAVVVGPVAVDSIADGFFAGRAVSGAGRLFVQQLLP